MRSVTLPSSAVLRGERDAGRRRLMWVGAVAGGVIVLTAPF